MGFGEVLGGVVLAVALMRRSAERSIDKGGLYCIKQAKNPHHRYGVPKAINLAVLKCLTMIWG